MLFDKITPEDAGVSSKLVHKFISGLNKRNLKMHSVLFMKGEQIFGEFYWAPFNAEFNHRMYSITKSFVSVAIGLLIDDGKIHLDDKVSELFPEKITMPISDELKNQTIEQMLTMTTVGQHCDWFTRDNPDRASLYFENREKTRAPGTVWAYDSAGSQVLCQICEKYSGMRLFDFLNERIFKHLGTFKNASILSTKNGASWGDSAMICTPRSLASFARFVMNYGAWGGKQLISQDYLKKATSRVVDNVTTPHEGLIHYGYGYQIWRTENNGFAFVGMGDQLAVCFPDKDFIFVCTADNQGSSFATDYIIGTLIDLILENMENQPLPADFEGFEGLNELGASLELFSLKGQRGSYLARELSGVKFVCDENDFGFKEFTFFFNEDGSGKLCYTNENGELELPFSMNKNYFGKFPELGYSQEYGGLRTTDGSKYDCATSLAWLQDNKILIYTQIIDRYFGNASLTFAFNGDNATLSFDKTAEDFLWNYKGVATAKKVK